ncbi:MAG: hypothetical protein PHE67_00590 [Campylobacterales bacterium]|nr:hypothetical protein [Campylobacterales bacterium]
MGTHSTIGYIKKGNPQIVYCHSDGHLEHNGVHFLAMLKYNADIFCKLIDIVLKNGDYFGGFGLQTSFYNLKAKTVLKHFRTGFARHNTIGMAEKHFNLLGTINVNLWRKEERGNGKIESFDEALQYQYAYVVDFDKDEIHVVSQQKHTILPLSHLGSLDIAAVEHILKDGIDLSCYREDYRENVIPHGIMRYLEYSDVLSESNLTDDLIFKEMLVNAVSVLNGCEDIQSVRSEYAEAV